MHNTKQRTVPLWAVLAKRRKNKYGGIPDLPDDELADPEELERQVYYDEYGPVLRLPVRGERSEFRPVVDESGHVDRGAFGTVDFDRRAMHFDKQRYRLERLRDELEHVLIMLGTVKRRLPGRAKYLVLKHVRMGVIDIEHIASQDLVFMVHLYGRARRLQDEIARLDESGRAMAPRQVAWLMS